MTLRILGGSAKGRELQVPDSARPTGARLRKSLFDLLAARFEPEQGVSFLDLHGGSGAIGLEAASRGYMVTLIEKDKRAAKLLEQNARKLELKARILQGDCLKLAPNLPPQDIVFSDPPYQEEISTLAAQLLKLELLSEGGLLICQHPSHLALPEQTETPTGYALEQRRYGSNVLSIYKWPHNPITN